MGHKPRVIFFLPSYRLGVTDLHAEQFRSLASVASLCGISGATEQSQGLISSVQETGLDLRIVPGIEFHRRFWTLVSHLRDLFRLERPEVVHVQTNWQLVLVSCALLCLRQKTAIVYTVHGYRNNHPIRSVLARYLIGIGLLLLADKVIFPSTELRSKLWIARKKGVFLPLGVAPLFFEGIPTGDRSGTKRIVFAGQFREGKRQDWIIRAVHQYIMRTHDDDVEVWLPGDGPQLESCKGLARDLGIERLVVFPGQLDRRAMLGVYSRCQFSVIASNSETFGHCIAEPFVLGKTILTRPVGIVRDVIRHGENGWIFDSERDLVESLCKILPNKELSVRMGETAYKERDFFSWNRISQDYADLLSDALRDKGL